MPIEEIEDCVAECAKELMLQYSGEEAMTVVAELAKNVKAGHLRSIETLDLGGNAIDPTSAEAFADMVLPGLQELTELDMRHNELGMDGIAALRPALCQHNGKLRTLSFAENKLRNEGAREVLITATGLPALGEISLGSNLLTPEICGVVAEAVLAQRSRALHTLSLEFNAFGDNGAIDMLVPLSRANTGITSLDLSDNHIGDDGVINGIVPLLRSRSTKLRRLNISVNKFGMKGAAAIASALATREAFLERLDVGENPLGEDGGLCLANAVLQPSRLEELDVTATRMTPKVMAVLMNAARSNRRLQQIHTGANDDVPTDDHEALYKLLRDVPRDESPFTPVTPSLFDRVPPAAIGAAIAVTAAAGVAFIMLRPRAR